MVDGEPWMIVDNEFVKPGKGQAFNRVKIKVPESLQAWIRAETKLGNPALEAKVPEDSDMRGQWGRRPQDTIDRANELLDSFAALLEKRGIRQLIARPKRPGPVQVTLSAKLEKGAGTLVSARGASQRESFRNFCCDPSGCAPETALVH